MRASWTSFRANDYRRGGAGSQALLVAHFFNGKTGIGRNDAYQSMRRIARQANLMKPFPDTDASVGRLQGGRLLLELFLPAPRSLGLLMSNSRAIVRDRLRAEPGRGEQKVWRAGYHPDTVTRTGVRPWPFAQTFMPYGAEAS